jgi:capsular polysaccharide biosynthesis protein
MEMQTYLKTLGRRWWILVLLPLITAGSAFGMSKFLMTEYVQGYPVYRASVQLSVEPARLEWGLANSVKAVLQNYVVQLDTEQMARDIIDEAQLDMQPEQLRSMWHVSSDESNFTLLIEVDDPDPVVAEQIAGTMAALFVQDRRKWNQDQDRQDQIDVEQLDDVRHVLYKPKTQINTLAGGIFGLLLGGGIVALLEWLEAAYVRTRDDLERTAGVPVLGAIPSMGVTESG